MYAKRMNRTYPVNTPQDRQSYLARGYDIYDDDNDLVEANPQKTVSFTEHQKLLAASNAMRKELYAVRAENEQLKTQLAALPITEDAPESVTPPAGVMEAFDTPPSMPTSEDAPDTNPPDDIKTLRSSDDPAPKMGKKK